MEENFNLVLRYTTEYGDDRVEIYFNCSRTTAKELLINTLSQPECYTDVEHNLSVASSNIHCGWGTLDVTFNTDHYDEDRADEEMLIIEKLRDEINAEVEEIKKKDLLEQVEARKQQEEQSLKQQEAQERELLYKLKQKYEQALHKHMRFHLFLQSYTKSNAYYNISEDKVVELVFQALTQRTYTKYSVVIADEPIYCSIGDMDVEIVASDFAEIDSHYQFQQDILNAIQLKIDLAVNQYEEQV